MAERLTRVSYVEANGRPRQDKTGNTESRVDMERYVQPLLRVHGAGLHGWGVATGLEITATIDSPDVRVSPGIALDDSGRHISLAAGGKAKLDDLSTAVVDETGVVVPTGDRTGEHWVTIAWAETFDRSTFTATGAFQTDETPLVRIVAAGDATAGDVVLASVELDAGAVTEVSAGDRRATGISVESVRFTAPASDDESVRDEETVRLGPADGGSGIGVYRKVGDGDELIFSVLSGGLAQATALRLTGGGAAANTATLMVFDGSADTTWNTAAFSKPALGPHVSHVHWGKTGDWFIRSASSAGKVILQDTGGPVGIGVGNPKHTLDVTIGMGLDGRLAMHHTGDGYLRFNQQGNFERGVHSATVFTAPSVSLGGAFGWGDPGFGNFAVTGSVGIGTEDFENGRLTVIGGESGPAVNASGVGNGTGLWAFGNPTAAFFGGDVRVTGTLTKGNNQFQIDHPLDPESRYLSHSAVESDEMKNVYDGETTLDADGTATIELPDWFEALNERFRYQLTPIGTAAPNLHVSAELAGNRFAIAGGPARAKVCWLVTGVRHDAFARANPLVVDAPKPEAERGTYLYPEAHGRPAGRALGPAQLRKA